MRVYDAIRDINRNGNRAAKIRENSVVICQTVCGLLPLSRTQSQTLFHSFLHLLYLNIGYLIPHSFSMLITLCNSDILSTLSSSSAPWAPWWDYILFLLVLIFFSLVSQSQIYFPSQIARAILDILTSLFLSFLLCFGFSTLSCSPSNLANQLVNPFK